MTRFRIAVFICLVAAILAAGGTIAAAESESDDDIDAGAELVEITDAELVDEEVTVGKVRVTVWYENESPQEENKELTISIDGVEHDKRLIFAEPGAGSSQIVFFHDLSPGEYEIDVEGDRTGTLTIPEREPHMFEEPLFGAVTYYPGIPIIILGSVLFASSFPIELVRAGKEYIGSGAGYGFDVTVKVLFLGSLLMIIGGIFTGGGGYLALIIGAGGLTGIVIVIGSLIGIQWAFGDRESGYL